MLLFGKQNQGRQQQQQQKIIIIIINEIKSEDKKEERESIIHKFQGERKNKLPFGIIMHSGIKY